MILINKINPSIKVSLASCIDTWMHWCMDAWMLDLRFILRWMIWIFLFLGNGEGISAFETEEERAQLIEECWICNIEDKSTCDAIISQTSNIINQSLSHTIHAISYDRNLKATSISETYVLNSIANASNGIRA
jgi:hypothetical protein